MTTVTANYAYAWLQNHAVYATQSDGTSVITGYLSVEKPIGSPDGANVQLTAFEWGYGPVRVRGVVDTSGVADITVSITVPVLGPINVADLGVNLQNPSATANIDLQIASGYATVSLQDTADVYLEVHITSPFGNVDFNRTKIFSFYELALNNGNARDLTFTCKDLGQNITLLLTFQAPDSDKLYVDEFPICWKVIQLQATGIDNAKVRYTADTAFMVPQLDSNDLVTASNARSCSTGQECTLISNGTTSSITQATAGDAGVLECVNSTAAKADIGIAFLESVPTGTDIIPALLWTDVPVKDMVKVQFTPVLQIYATSDYQETKVIRGEIESPLIWSQNLEALDPSTTLSVTVDASTGQVNISTVSA